MKIECNTVTCEGSFQDIKKDLKYLCEEFNIINAQTENEIAAIRAIIKSANNNSIRKIHAIKEMRNNTNLSLKEAKDLVESVIGKMSVLFHREISIVHPDKEDFIGTPEIQATPDDEIQSCPACGRILRNFTHKCPVGGCISCNDFCSMCSKNIGDH